MHRTNNQEILRAKRRAQDDVPGESDLMEKILKKTLANGVFDAVKPVHSKVMKAVKGKGNKTTEVHFRLALVRAKISGWKMHAKLTGKPDILFPNEKIAIFLDGCFWHGCPDCGHIPKTNTLYWLTKIARNKERDKINNELLKNNGYAILRFWEHELVHDMDQCIAHLMKILRLVKNNNDPVPLLQTR
jgi:DNA mismatch endonuclease (patch repair protein)